VFHIPEADILEVAEALQVPTTDRPLHDVLVECLREIKRQVDLGQLTFEHSLVGFFNYCTEGD
jgi:hypothetical protein